MAVISMHIKIAILLISFQVAMTSNAAEIVFKDHAGRILTTEDIRSASGQFNWEIRSGRPVPPEATKMHQQGREAGQQGDNIAAIEYFERAARIAPSWPYPIYEEAFTYLLMGNFKKALELYEKVDAQMPRGFFTAKTAVHSLRAEMKGEFPKGTYLYYLSIELTNDTHKQLQVADTLTTKVPSFAPAWKAKASLEPDDEKRLGYLESGLKANPDPETRGFLLINKALILHSRGQKAEAIRILGELALDPASPLDIEAIAKKSLAMLVAK